ncbi:MAG: polysaccharide biosynthesis/export family protein [Acidobacteria bacterium]|nr:polysaccharide biosynthesis/export family protein [Acidobacteriota bacterium]
MMRHWIVVFSLALGVIPAPAQEKQEKKDPAVNEPKRSIEDLKAAGGPAAPVDPRSYKIGPEDIISIRVWREPELSGPVMVRPDGKITMPLVGEIQAAGETPEGLSRGVTEALSKIMNRPDVFIQVQQVNSRKYYISGEVGRVGAFPLVTPVTVLEAISSAGGLREFANGSKIVIVRGDKRLKFNYKEVIKGKNLQQNILIESGDHIIVP